MRKDGKSAGGSNTGDATDSLEEISFLRLSESEQYQLFIADPVRYEQSGAGSFAQFAQCTGRGPQPVSNPGYLQNGVVLGDPDHLTSEVFVQVDPSTRSPGSTHDRRVFSSPR